MRSLGTVSVGVVAVLLLGCFGCSSSDGESGDNASIIDPVDLGGDTNEPAGDVSGDWSFDSSLSGTCVPGGALPFSGAMQITDHTATVDFLFDGTPCDSEASGPRSGDTVSASGAPRVTFGDCTVDLQFDISIEFGPTVFFGDLSATLANPAGDCGPINFPCSASGAIRGDRCNACFGACTGP